MPFCANCAKFSPRQNLSEYDILLIVLPSKLVLSWLYQFLDFALKSPMVVIRNGFFAPQYPKSFQNYQKKFQIHLGIGLGIYKELRSCKLQIERQSLSFFLGPGLTSTSPLSITRRLQSHANTISKIWNNKKFRIQNFMVIFKTPSLEKNKEHRQM